MSSPKKPPNRIIWYSFILLVLLAVPVSLIPMMLKNSQPAFESLDSVKPDQIATLEIRLFNIQHIVPSMPDGGRAPDTIGPFTVKTEDVDGMLKELQGGTLQTSMPPTPWLGEYRFTLADGRKQTVRIRFGGGNPDQGVPHKVFFQINKELVFDTQTTVNRLVDKAAQAERKAKGG
jgi:hypothetical protein